MKGEREEFVVGVTAGVVLSAVIVAVVVIMFKFCNC